MPTDLYIVESSKRVAHLTADQPDDGMRVKTICNRRIRWTVRRAFNGASWSERRDTGHACKLCVVANDAWLLA